MRLFQTLFFISLFSISSFAFPFYAEPDQSFFRKKNISELVKLAKTGDKNAQFKLGYAYQTGTGILKDSNQAKFWYKKAAVSLGSAQNNLGLLLLESDIKNQKEAITLLNKAVKADFAYAKMNLAHILVEGKLVKQDLKYAFKLSLEAAEESHLPIAQYLVGLMYADGIGVKTDFPKAYSFFLPAADAGYPAAQFEIGMFNQYGHGTPVDLENAANMYYKAAISGDAKAQLYLGMMYVDGNGRKQDYSKALYWLKKSAHQGSLDAQVNIGIIYYNGYGVDKNYPEAFKWYKKSAKDNHPLGQLALAVMYIEQKGVVQDIPEGIKWLKKSAAQGNQQAVRILKKLEQQLK